MAHDKARATALESEARPLVEANIGPRALSRELNIPYTTAHDLIKRLKQQLGGATRQGEIEVPELPDGDLPIDELRRRRRETFVLAKRAQEARRLIPVKVKIEGPIGITWFGDPHIDDDGCNWPQLEADIATVKATKGMYAGNIGDTNNNWVGRLARLWENQSTTGRQAWKLVEWFVHELPWLVFIKGNHGGWSGSGDPLDWMMRDAPSMLDEMEARFELQFSTGVKSSVFARHDFPGHSQWNPLHGLAKAASFGGYDDTLLVAGHKHTSGYLQVLNPKSRVITHAVRAGGYKVIDHYAKEHFFKDGNFAESVVSVFDPAYDPTDRRHCNVFMDVQQGAEYLTYLRKKGGF